MNATITAARPDIDVDVVGRDTGIPAIGPVPWGTHFCQFYTTKQDLLDTLVPYFRVGLENNEACVWGTYPPLEPEDVMTAMCREMTDFEHRVAAGQMTVMSDVKSWYYEPDGRFDHNKILSMVKPMVAGYLQRGYSGMRVHGNMACVDTRDWDSCLAYEQGFNEVTAGRPIIGMCAYSLDRCDAGHLTDVLLRHRYALIKRGDWVLIEPSERKRATEVVERMNQALAERTSELQEALANLRGFSRWVSHDLRAPLRSITSFGEILDDSCKGLLADEQQHMLRRIRANAARMDQLITDILAYSMAQRTELTAGRLDMPALARNACDGLADLAAQHRVRLALRPMPPAVGDPATVSQVLANLIGNAIKFSAGTPDAQVEVGATTTAGPETAYYVRDNGVGFDMAHASKMFGAFERLHGASFDGTGLGLAIVKEIVSRHGGRVWANSSPGAGATFYFTLPAAEGAAAITAAAAP